MLRSDVKVAATVWIVCIIGIGTVGASYPAAASCGPKTRSSAGLPDGLRRAAIATRSDSVGMIAGARVPGTDVHIVYMRTGRGCGTAGCRSQVWKREGARFVRIGSLPAGRLPIVVLPARARGRPLLGLTVVAGSGTRLGVLPIDIDANGSRLSADNRLLPVGLGVVLLAAAMLQPF